MNRVKYNETMMKRVRSYGTALGGEPGKLFRSDMRDIVGLEVQGETEFDRGVVEGERRLAIRILNMISEDKHE